MPSGRKEWAPFDVPTATEFNGYLVDQSVMTFADSTARTTAIASPSEGMVTYLTDTDSLEQYQGSSWVQLNPSSPADAHVALFLHHS